MNTVPTRDGEISEQEFRERLALLPTDVDQFMPRCCGGLGYVRLERPLGTFEFGKIAVCPKCKPKLPVEDGPKAWAP